MVSTAASVSAQSAELSLTRLYVLRFVYLLIGAGEGSQVVPVLFNHEPAARGVIPSLLAGMCLLDLLGLKYPRQMLPLLLFEFAWKWIWMLAFGLPQYFSGQQPPTFGEDFFNIGFGVILMPLVIPWAYVWRHYVTAPGDRWQ
ncbi:MAG: hypothetical protein ACJ8FT_10210 [Sphingomonas sp.]